MNIIIPLCGRGERFKKVGYRESKPFIKVLDKSIIFYVLDNLNFSKDDEIFIFYHSDLDYNNTTNETFRDIIESRYSKHDDSNKFHFVNINKYTRGASETIRIGLEKLEKLEKNRIASDRISICIDCDNFYMYDILSQIKTKGKLYEGGVINTVNKSLDPVYSYITKDENNIITNIKEKEKISDLINTGVYFFKNIEILYNYCKIVSDDNSMYMNGECYMSCVLKRMLQDGLQIISIEIPIDSYYNLGTPNQVNEFIENTHAFLFDLDGTLVITDDIYFEVWYEILREYNINIDKEFYQKYIFGNTDLQVLHTVLYNVNETLENLSRKKDEHFLTHKNKIKLANGVILFFQKIKKCAHKIGIVTNCNRNVAEQVLDYFDLTKYIDCLIIGNECFRSKPYPDPYLEACKVLNVSNDKVIIFEDSNNGLLSAKNMFPKKIIAIETVYDDQVYKKLGVHKVIKNFEEFINVDIKQIIMEDKSDECEQLKRNIHCSLRKNKLFDENIEDIIIDQAKLKGGYISDVISLEIITKFDRYNVVLKLENKNKSFLSDMANKLGLYEREYYFYEHISKFVSVKIPKYYGIVYDENNNRIGILLENLYKSDRKNNENMISNINLSNISIEHTLRIIDECAKLHTKFIDKNLQEFFPKLLKHNDMFFSSWKDFMMDKWIIFQDKWKFILKENHCNVIKNAIDKFEKIQEHLSKGKLSFCHGDVKTLNMFFKKKQNIYNPYFIDWQYINNGKGVQDIVFFLMESFNVESIKQNHKLIKEYYYIKCLEYGVKNYSKKEYDLDFLFAIFHFPLFVCIWFGTLSQEDLIDKNFPYFFIQKFLCIIDLYEKEIQYLF